MLCNASTISVANMGITHCGKGYQDGTALFIDYLAISLPSLIQGVEVLENCEN
jgi:hypothetical protein